VGVLRWQSTPKTGFLVVVIAVLFKQRCTDCDTDRALGEASPARASNVDTNSPPSVAQLQRGAEVFDQTSFAHQHRDDVVKGPLREVDGACNIKIAIKIGIPAKQELFSLQLSSTPLLKGNRSDAIACRRRHRGQCAHRRQCTHRGQGEHRSGQGEHRSGQVEHCSG